jgi:predicted acyl esterase
LGLHLRGTIKGYLGIGSKKKWLKIQAGSYFHTFLQPKNVVLQKRFFDQYLKGIDGCWDSEPKVEVEIRSVGDTVKRIATSTAWPFPQSNWTRYYLDADCGAISPSKPEIGAHVDYAALSEGVTFSSEPFTQDIEIVGPIVAKLFVSSTTDDMDLFVTLCAFDKDGNEMTFLGAPEPKAPVTQGWLRVSQRKQDPDLSEEFLPYFPHDERQLMTPNVVYEVNVEIWPTGLALPSGSQISLIIQGRDFERPGATGPLRGVAWFTHTSPVDRPPAVFCGTNTIHTGGSTSSFLLLPILSGE